MQLSVNLIGYFQQRSVQVVLLSEYGISAVHTGHSPEPAVSRARMADDQGGVRARISRLRREPGFAVADHQVAHIYCKDPLLMSAVRDVLEKQPGVEAVFSGETRHAQRTGP